MVLKLEAKLQNIKRGGIALASGDGMAAFEEGLESEVQRKLEIKHAEKFEQSTGGSASNQANNVIIINNNNNTTNDGNNDYKNCSKDQPPKTQTLGFKTVIPHHSCLENNICSIV